MGRVTTNGKLNKVQYHNPNSHKINLISESPTDMPLAFIMTAITLNSPHKTNFHYSTSTKYCYRHEI